MSASFDSAPGERLQTLTAAYRPLPGVFDEMVSADGAVRPHWRPLMAALARLGPQEIERRFAAADRHLRESGVFYRVYEDPTGAERPWPLSHIPLVVDPEEWQTLAAGAIQRAEILEWLLADAYGDRRMVREGRIPAAVLAGNPEFLRPLVGVIPPGGSFLRFYAVDVGRGSDGRWWVLSDRAQAPSGAGYALENRLALSRGMPDVYRALQIERLAPFFQAFQAELSSFNRRDDSRVCLLTPGPLNETYFEHAYLARYLGFLLVEGEDLTVRDDGVFLRTISGLKRAEVLMRRLDADFADPLELNARSRLGVPGLVQALRNGDVVIANALGSGLAEARAWMSFLPALAERAIGEPLLLPNVATWWLGEAQARDEALARMDELVIAPAFEGELPSGETEALVASLDAGTRARLIGDIKRRGVDYVAQEAVTLSTMPVWSKGALEPRPFILRLFLARTHRGWTVMPGGFVRVADTVDARAVSLQHGGSTADAWITAEGPVQETTLLPAPGDIAIKRVTGWLPSRAADNLFWVGRYVERAEATLRLVRALLTRAADDEEAVTLGSAITALLGTWNAVPTAIPTARPALVAAAALKRDDLTGSIPTLVANARAAASVIRDRFSPDAWRALTDLALFVAEPIAPGTLEAAMLERVNGALRIVASFAGLAQENMNQLAGWRFLDLGRRIERGILTGTFVRRFGLALSSDRAFDLLLELADSQITYRLRYVMVAARAPVIDLVALDPHNPRSILFQLERIEAHLAALPTRTENGRLSAPQQIAAALTTALRTMDATMIKEEAVALTEEALMKLADTVATSYFTTQERSEDHWEALG